MPPREVIFTGQFRRDFAKFVEGTDAEPLFDEVLTRLVARRPLETRWLDHPLKGNWKGCRDCHVKNDLVFIYEAGPRRLICRRIGSHAELFRR